MKNIRPHLAPLIFLAGLTLLWTWPLPLHLRTDIPGLPGDNYSFLWNLWWARRSLGSDDPGFFHSVYLMYPFGVDLVNHPHTALQGIVSATALAGLSVIEAENLYILASVFLNGAAAYALAFDLTGHRRAALLAAVAFGSSPYIGAHLLGHFDLLSAWVLPAFMLCLRRALAGRSTVPAIGCGVILAVAAYTAYYHVVYLGLMAVVYTVAALHLIRIGMEARARSRGAVLTGRAALALLCLDGLVIFWAAATGGATMRLAGLTISIRQLHNPLTIAWLLVLIWTLTRWRPRIHVVRPSRAVSRRVLRVALVTGALFAVCAAPLIVEAIRLGLSGRYVSPTYFWRSAPRGIDLMAGFGGNPFHPLLGPAVGRLYQAAGLDRIEAVGWLGLVPLLLLVAPRGQWLKAEEASRWKLVFGVSFLWALGPFLTVAGFDAGLPLPQSLMRFVPVVANARMPGRAMVAVYLALGMLMALRLAALEGHWRRSAVQWALIAGLALDFLNAPIPLTPLDHPIVYARLSAIDDGGAVIELPFGIGDGLTRGAGSQDRRILYYATLHGHPVVGGFIGRMPPGAAEAYERMLVVGDLLRLSSGERLPSAHAGAPPFRYLVVNTQSASAELLAYVRGNLDLERLAAGDDRELYAVRGVR